MAGCTDSDFQSVQTAYKRSLAVGLLICEQKDAHSPPARQIMHDRYRFAHAFLQRRDGENPDLGDRGLLDMAADVSPFRKGHEFPIESTAGRAITNDRRYELRRAMKRLLTPVTSRATLSRFEPLTRSARRRPAPPRRAQGERRGRRRGPRAHRRDAGAGGPGRARFPL